MAADSVQKDVITLSVVIPTFNRADSLGRTLRGLSAQTYPTDLYEVLVISDGSTDHTADVVAAYRASVLNSVRFIEQTNSGPSVARNRGISEAVNDVVVFLDDDVEPVSEFLAQHASWHKKGDHFAVIGPMSPDPCCSNDEPPWITWEHQKLDRVYSMFKEGGVNHGHTGAPVHFYSGNASVVRRRLNYLGGFDTRYTRQEDVELATRLSKDVGVQFVFEFRAHGIHRPTRTFKSWLKIPQEYGRLDAQRLAEGTLSYQTVIDNLRNRHPLTRAVTAISQSSDSAGRVCVWLLSSAALSASRFASRQLAVTILSGLYNAAYCQSFFANSEARNSFNHARQTALTEAITNSHRPTPGIKRTGR